MAIQKRQIVFFETVPVSDAAEKIQHIGWDRRAAERGYSENKEGLFPFGRSESGRMCRRFHSDHAGRIYRTFFYAE